MVLSFGRHRRPLAIAGLLGHADAVPKTGEPVLDGPRSFRRAKTRNPVAPGRNVGRLAAATKLQKIGEPVLEAFGVVFRTPVMQFGAADQVPMRLGELVITAMLVAL